MNPNRYVLALEASARRRAHRTVRGRSSAGRYLIALQAWRGSAAFLLARLAPPQTCEGAAMWILIGVIVLDRARRRLRRLVRVLVDARGFRGRQSGSAKLARARRHY